MKNPFEARPIPAESAAEKFLSREDVLGAMEKFAEGYVVTRELTDEVGLYLLEVEVPGEKEGEVTEYKYIRKGVHSKSNQSEETAIDVTAYEDGMPISGFRLAILDEATGSWQGSDRTFLG